MHTEFLVSALANHIRHTVLVRKMAGHDLRPGGPETPGIATRTPAGPTST
jgi:hypothetical protein